MLTFLKIFIFTGIIFGFAQAGKIVPKAETKELLQAASQETKIYGGRDTHIHEAPYQAYFQGCSGVIISSTFILTAAHCLPRRRFWNYSYNIRVGSANRTTGGQLIQAKKFIPHPKFSPSGHELDINLSYDIGLIELKSPIKFNKNASAIELAKNEVPVGKVVMISGWGYTHPDATELSEYLQSIEVPIIDRKTCEEKIQNWGFIAPDITDYMICNYEYGKETCKGDSGGPVVFNKTLVGIVSWGHPDCSESPGVNVNVAHPEIQTFIKDNSNIGKMMEVAKTTDSSDVDKQDTKIFGGRDTQIHEAPYIAALQTTKDGEHICGGVIISETMILTAAHCIHKRVEKCPNDFIVRVGSSNRTSGGQLIPIQECVPHKDFDTDRLVYDVGIIKLKSPIILNENTTVLELAKNHIPTGEKVMISGWGFVQPNNDTYPEYLQSIVVPIMDREECQKMVMNQNPDSYNVTDDMICHFEQGKETCRGDSGSPLVYDNTLIGVVSWGPCNECGKHPGVNAYVVHCEIRDFIIKQLASGTPDSTKIIGGTNTKISEVPWTAALEFEGRHFCGGTIISEKFILTAAHCFDIRGTKNIKVRVGSTCSNYGGKIIDAKNITKHSKYIHTEERLDYDVAVIELLDEIPTEKASAIKLAKEEVATGVNVTIAGWGKVTDDLNTRGSNILQSVIVPIIDWNQCKKRMSELPVIPKLPKVTKTMICGQRRGHNTCHGDSGGPVSIGSDQVVGIVSWGNPYPCAIEPAVYTNFANSEIRSFIRDVTKL